MIMKSLNSHQRFTNQSLTEVGRWMSTSVSRPSLLLAVVAGYGYGRWCHAYTRNRKNTTLASDRYHYQLMTDHFVFYIRQKTGNGSAILLSIWQKEWCKSAAKALISCRCHYLICLKIYIHTRSCFERSRVEWSWVTFAIYLTRSLYIVSPLVTKVFEISLVVRRAIVTLEHGIVETLYKPTDLILYEVKKRIDRSIQSSMYFVLLKSIGCSDPCKMEKREINRIAPKFN
jgi:hypothetical protein